MTISFGLKAISTGHVYIMWSQVEKIYILLVTLVKKKKSAKLLICSNVTKSHCVYSACQLALTAPYVVMISFLIYDITQIFMQVNFSEIVMTKVASVIGVHCTYCLQSEMF